MTIANTLRQCGVLGVNRRNGDYVLAATKGGNMKRQMAFIAVFGALMLLMFGAPAEAQGPQPMHSDPYWLAQYWNNKYLNGDPVTRWEPQTLSTTYTRGGSVPFTIGVSLNCSMPTEIFGVPGMNSGSQNGSVWYSQVDGSSRLQVGLPFASTL